MRVLTTTMVYPTRDDPDQGLFVRRRATALAARADLDLEVVAPQPWCPILRHCCAHPAADEPLPTEHPRFVSMPVIGWFTDGWSYGRALTRVMRRKLRTTGKPFDLMDAHFAYPDGVGAWWTAHRMGLPLVVTARGKVAGLAERPERRAQIRAMLRAADGLIAVSTNLAEIFRQFAEADLPVRVIPNAIDTETFHSLDRLSARTRLGWSTDARYILAVGHLQRIKGFDRVVAAMGRIRHLLPDAKLILVGSRRGETSFKRAIKRAIDRVNAGDPPNAPTVQFIGPATPDQLNLMYNAADVTVNAARNEGWNNAISESLAAGTPVVATAVGGNAEQLANPRLGLVVPDGDNNALTDALVRALIRPWPRADIARHGQSRSWHTVAEEVAEVFTEAVQRRKAAAAPCRQAGKSPSSATPAPGTEPIAWGGTP